MSEITFRNPSTRFKVGWAILFALSLLSTLSNFSLIFVVPGKADSFIAWSTFSVYAVVVLLIPYRHGAKWAWYLTWVLPIPFAVLVLNDPDAAPFFSTAIVLMLVGQLLTHGALFQNDGC
jgi:hypothetical protein